MNMDQLSALLAQTAHDVLLWVGFGTLVGLAAKAIMPGRDPGGAVATLLMGIAGSIIGCGATAFFFDAKNVTPISPAGFGLGTAGAFLLLAVYRLLNGSVIDESEEASPLKWWNRRRRSRRAPARG